MCCLIPARYASSRLPGKPLLKINNKTIIQLTWECCQNTKYINKNDIYVVTDDMRIKEEIESNNGNVIMVTEKCLNGTERICKALPKLQKDYDIVINVQGDEPFIKSQHIDIAIKKIIDNMNDNNCVCSTLHYIIKNKEHVYDRSVCKMILDKNDNVLYGSRAMIPHTKSGKCDKNTKYYGHIGLMIYKREYLFKYMKVNTMAQLAEDIEWLKIMEDGYSLISAQVDQVEIGVNTMDDYQYLLAKYQNNQVQTREQ